MNFDLLPFLAEQPERAWHFLREVIPLEDDPRSEPRSPSAYLQPELVALTRVVECLTLHAPNGLGGLGLDRLAKVVMFKEAECFLPGPTARNMHAPDEVNIHLMHDLDMPAQVKRWLRPRAEDYPLACCAMTGPDRAGSHPSMLAMTAQSDGDDFLIGGRRWFMTDEDGAGRAIELPRMVDGFPTMFLTEMARPESQLERMTDEMVSCSPSWTCTPAGSTTGQARCTLGMARKIGQARRM